MKFIPILNEKYKEEKEFFEGEQYDKYEFVSSIFDFATCDNGEGSASNYLCDKMIEVIRSILNKQTFAYQEKSHENYLNYITMVNMPFLNDKLDWGTSIRGAWFELFRPNDSKAKHLISNLDIQFSVEDTEEFMQDLINWWDNYDETNNG